MVRRHNISLIFSRNKIFFFPNKQTNNSATTDVLGGRNGKMLQVDEKKVGKRRSQTELRRRRNAWLGDRDSTGRAAGGNGDVQVLGSDVRCCRRRRRCCGSGPFLRGVADPGHHHHQEGRGLGGGIRGRNTADPN